MTNTTSPSISACIITFNEEDNIGRCIDSVDFCDDIVVVDSHSTDRTVAIAEEKGARVFDRDWPGFGHQKNFAVDQAVHDWVLCLDADEWLSPELKSEISSLTESDLSLNAGWSMPRLASYFGTWIRRGGWYPDRQLRLYDRRKGTWGGRPPHEHVELDAGSNSRGRLGGDLFHIPYRSIDDHLQKIDAYTTTMAKEMLAQGKRAAVHDLILRPTLRFLRFYLIKGAIVHGWVGLFLSYLDAHYVRMKYGKLLALQRGLPLVDESRK